VTDANAAGRATTPPLAVVGLACRFPEADDPAALLDAVLTGRRAFRRLPPGRIDLADYYQPDPATTDATYSTRAALIEGWRFERAAFGVAQDAYAAADPAHWLALETAARALAAAGLPAGSGLDRDRTGVIIGNTLTGDTSRANALRVRWPYVRRVLSDALGTDEISADQAGIVLQRAETGYLAPFPPIGKDSLAGSMPGTIASTISTYFGFRGGSHAVDSACSSSLQAVASACAALATGDLDAAIAGGVDLSLDPLELIGLAKAGVLATSDVRIYDEDPTGYLPGEGCGVVVLMRAADARAAGLPVYAEILGWGVSAGAVPGEPQSQASSQLLAMRRAYDRAGVDPADIHYLEGNGAGTRADDLAELTALASIRAGAGQRAALGSVKANIGHAKAAAGAAGLIKTVLALGTGVVPPTTGAGRPHELIAEGGASVTMPQRPGDWPDGTRLAAVSTMGTGGSNVHVVLRHEPAPRARQDRWLRSIPMLAKASRPGPASAQPRVSGGPECLPFLLHARDRFALAAVLSRLADIAGWLSDAEMSDLACMLGRQSAGSGGVRVGLVATRQEQLAVLAREAVTILPQLGDGLLTVRPGIFAADGADGRVTLLLSDAPQAAGLPLSPADLISAVRGCLDTLRWLESLGVLATAAAGDGLGSLAGLAWSGVLGEKEVVEIAELRAQFLTRSAEKPTAGDAGTAGQASQADNESDGSQTAVERSGAAELRAAIAQRFRFGPPRRRLIPAATGIELDSVGAAIDLICRGFAGAGKLSEAITEAAVGATLMVETGPGRSLVSAAAGVSRVPAISLQSGYDDAMNRARSAAALFAAGALSEPHALFAGRQARSVDIWREQVFITSPCQTVPYPRLAFDTAGQPAESVPVSREAPATIAEQAAPEPAADHVAADEDGLAAVREEIERRLPARPLISATASLTAGAEPGAAEEPAGAEAVTVEPVADQPAATGPLATEALAAAATTAGPAAADGGTDTTGTGDPAASGGAARREAVVASSVTGPVTGLRPWARCFAETLRPVADGRNLPEQLPRRLFAAARSPELTDVSGLFTADPAARRTLAIVEDPADDRSRVTAIDAACDALSTGELVVITTSPEFSGFFATLHAEHPSLGITVLRIPARGTSPAPILEHAHAEPGQFRELIVSADGTVSEPVMTDIPLTGRAQCPLGPDDVVLITRPTAGAGLALAQVLACTGAGIAVVGRESDHDDSELVAGLEQLRSAGARIGYEVIDLGDVASLTAALHRIEDRLGPVTAVAHASAADGHVPCRELTNSRYSRELTRAASELDSLAAAIRPGQLKLIVTVGSVAGRYGLAGAGMQALGSGVLASRAASLASASAGCRALHLDLPAWSAENLGEPPELTAALTAADCPALEISAASRMLLKVLMTADLPGRLTLHGRIGGLATRPAPSVSQAAMAAAGLPGGARFLQEVSVHYPGIELVAEVRMSLASDPYLGDYRVDGMLVLPPALAIEALAQAASVLAGRPMRRAMTVTLPSPVLIPSRGDASLRVCAQREGDGIVAALRCADSSYLIDHARAEFSCAAEPELTQPAVIAAGTSALQPLAAGPSGLVDGAEIYGPVCFQAGRFRRIALLPEVTARSGRALARGTDELPWYPAGSELSGTGFLLASPGLNDAALQVLQACVPHRRVRPAGCDSVQFSGREAEGPVEIRAVAEPVRAARPAGDSRAVVIPGQPGAPAAEKDDSGAAAGGGPAEDGLSDAQPPAGPVSATRAAQMTAEERADLEIAERRPVGRKSRRAARQHETRVRQHETRASRAEIVPAAGHAPAAEALELAAAVQAPERAAAVAAPEPEPGQAREPLAGERWDVEAVDAAGHLLAAWRGVTLHDAGPLPRNAAWPPTLLSVFLERSAAELGLADGLRVTVSCGHPDGPLPDLLSVIPRPSPPADGLPTSTGRPGTDRPAGSASPRPAHTASVPGIGLLAGFALTLRGPVPVAGGWSAAESGHRTSQPPAGMAGIYARLRAELGDPAPSLAARLDAIGACLAPLAAVDLAQLTLVRAASDGWVVLALGELRIVSTVVEMSGVPVPVAIALLAGGPERAPAGQRAGGHKTVSSTQHGREAARTS
jgi:enediyne polyketide synthase